MADFCNYLFCIKHPFYSFYLSNNSVVLEKGETFQLLATYGNEFITYSSSNETVAEITQNGIITAKELGKTQITVKAGGKERICEVEVVTYEYTVSFDKTGPIYAYNATAFLRLF